MKNHLDTDKDPKNNFNYCIHIDFKNCSYKLTALTYLCTKKYFFIQPKYDDSINIIVEEPDGVKKRCRVQRITYKNFLSVCEEVIKLEHKIPSLPQPPPLTPTPMITTKPIFNSPATR